MNISRLLVRSALFWAAVILMAVGSVFLTFGGFMIRDERLYAREGKTVEGMVLTKEVRQATTSGSGSSRRRSGTSTDYILRYRFNTPDGAAIEGREAVPIDIWEGVEERGPIRIEYAASDPRTNHVAGQSSALFSYLFASIGAVLALTSLSLLVPALRRAGTKARIWSQGVPVEATVTSVEPGNVTVNDRRLWVVRYRYRDHAGQSHDGVSDHLSAEAAQAWKMGDTGSARFDPQQPRNSIWIGTTAPFLRSAGGQ